MKKFISFLFPVILLLSACGAKTPPPQAALPITAVVQPTATALPASATPTLAPPTFTPEPTITSTPETTLFPLVTFTATTICRLGPDLNYFSVTTFSADQTTQAQGRSEDSNWLIVMSQAKNKSSTCWIPVESVEKFGEVSGLTTYVAPPLPVGPIRAVATGSACGNNSGSKPIRISWSPKVEGVGYYVYRNGKNIATVFSDFYLERQTPNSRDPYVYAYGIQAFNSVGLSKVTASVSVTLCK